MMSLLLTMKEARLQRGLSQKTVAEKAGFAISQISIWERGLTTPNLANYVAWANALGMEVAVGAVGDTVIVQPLGLLEVARGNAERPMRPLTGPAKSDKTNGVATMKV